LVRPRGVLSPSRPDFRRDATGLDVIEDPVLVFFGLSLRSLEPLDGWFSRLRAVGPSPVQSIAAYCARLQGRRRK
jgi:hypothetical protein